MLDHFVIDVDKITESEKDERKTQHVKKSKINTIETYFGPGKYGKLKVENIDVSKDEKIYTPIPFGGWSLEQKPIRSKFVNIFKSQIEGKISLQVQRSFHAVAFCDFKEVDYCLSFTC